jgi:hypothetical protein
MIHKNKLRFAPRYLWTDDHRPGPCYVLDPAAWMRGERLVLAVLPPKLDKEPRRLVPTIPPPEPTETRLLAVWPKGRPWDWRLENVLVRRAEPAWAGRARALRAQGWSIRRTMKELGVKNRQKMDSVLTG